MELGAGAVVLAHAAGAGVYLPLAHAYLYNSEWRGGSLTGRAAFAADCYAPPLAGLHVSLQNM